MANQNSLTDNQLQQLAKIISELASDQSLIREVADEISCDLLNDIAGCECLNERETQEITDEIWNIIQQTS